MLGALVPPKIFSWVDMAVIGELLVLGDGASLISITWPVVVSAVCGVLNAADTQKEK